MGRIWFHTPGVPSRFGNVLSVFTVPYPNQFTFSIDTIEKGRKTGEVYQSKTLGYTYFPSSGWESNMERITTVIAWHLESGIAEFQPVASIDSVYGVPRHQRWNWLMSEPNRIHLYVLVLLCWHWWPGLGSMYENPWLVTWHNSCSRRTSVVKMSQRTVGDEHSRFMNERCKRMKD